MNYGWSIVLTVVLLLAMTFAGVWGLFTAIAPYGRWASPRHRWRPLLVGVLVVVVWMAVIADAIQEGHERDCRAGVAVRQCAGR